MEKNDLFEKNKTKILSTGLILLALFLAFKIYKSGDEQVNSLIQQKDIELKKNNALEEIAGLEKKVESYKRVFVKKDLSSVIDTISNIAKNCSVKIISIKPNSEEAYPDYIKSFFVITISSPSYHSLGDFVSQIENYKDIYLVEELSISLTDPSSSAKNTNKNLSVNLKISTIFYQ
ncbi:MAG: type 4a pilus biogenesis protein PilO [Candidatus Omnitrophota bacterium]